MSSTAKCSAVYVSQFRRQRGIVEIVIWIWNAEGGMSEEGIGGWSIGWIPARHGKHQTIRIRRS